MIIEHRTYQILPGQLNNYMKIYGEEGLVLQRKYLGDPVGWYFTDIGILNSVVHLWQYEDATDRSRRRTALASDQDWQAFLPKVTPLIQDMQSSILLPAPFFDLPRRRSEAAM